MALMADDDIGSQCPRLARQAHKQVDFQLPLFYKVKAKYGMIIVNRLH